MPLAVSLLTGNFSKIPLVRNYNIVLSLDLTFSIALLAGGVEALIQLSIALTHAVHNPLEVFVTDIDYHEKWRRLYGGSLITRTKSLNQLHKGDLFITNEGIGCFNHSPDVEVFVWILANYLGCKSGVRYISHNRFLTNYTFDDKYVRLPLERVINPYISQPIVKHAMKFSGLHSDGSIAYHRSQLHLVKANVVLTDNDISPGVFDVVRRVADKMGVKVINLMELNSTQLTQAYEQSKIIIDWCMRGSERCPMEAALYGAVLLTNNCETGSSFVDFPIPSKFILPQGRETIDNNDKELEAMLEKQFTDIFANYWDYVPMFEPLRRAILDRSPRNMVSDATRFLQTLHVTESSPQSEWLMLDGCKGC